MPADAPAIKRERVAADGAEIVTVGTASRRAARGAEAIAAERGLAIIPPYDDDRIIAGQGTVGLEIAEDLPDVAAVVVPVGGGGLASGVAVGHQGARPGRARDRRRAGARRGRARSLERGRDRRAGRPSDVSRTIADGTRTQALGRARSRTCAPTSTASSPYRGRDRGRGPAGGRTVPPRRRAVRGPGPRRHRVPRARSSGWTIADGPVVGVVSGGNVDPAQYRAYLEAPLPG